MESSQKYKKIGIIVGLEREKKLVPKCSNIFVEKGYGKKAYNASKKILKKKVDVLISFGLAKSINTKIKNSNIVIPTKVFNEKGENFNTSEYYNKILKKKINQKIWNKNLLSISKILEKNDYKHDNNIGIIDMESFFIHKAAFKNKIPCTTVRVIFDDTKLEIPSYILDSLNKNGEVKPFHLLKKIICNPFRIQKLMILAINYHKSKLTLKRVLKTINT